MALPKSAVASALAAAILLATLFAYSPVRTAVLVYEDQSAVVETAMAHAPINWLRTRALTRATYAFDMWRGSGDPRPFHTTNLLLHLLNGGLVWLFARRLVAPARATVAAVLFLLHPLPSEAVAYVAGRTELLSTTGILIALLCVEGDGLQLSASRIGGAAVALALAVWAKESAIVGAGLVAWYLAIYGPPLWRRNLRRAWLPAVVLGLSLLAITYTVIQHEYMVQSDLPLWQYANLQWLAFWRFLLLAVWPWGQTVDHSFELWPLWMARTAGFLSLLGLLAAIQVIAIDWFVNPRVWVTLVPRLSVFVAGWVLLALAPRFVMRIPEVLNEHQMYLPCVGLALIGACLWPATEPKEMTDAFVAA